MNELPNGYEDEPQELFHPLPDELGVQFYDIELADFLADVPFYDQRLPDDGRILELGCGSGRLLSALARNSRKLYGGDLSPTMLNVAKRRVTHGATRLICLDMQRPPFMTQFSAILIAYNTLNLLGDATAVMSCLDGCRKLLKSGGIILLQLFLPDESCYDKTSTTFQFQIFDHPDGGQLIKEIRKTPNRSAQTISVHERFRVRVRRGDIILKEDYEHTFAVLAWPLAKWQKFFDLARLHLDEIQFGYDCNLKQQTASIALLQLSPQ